jgi:hypothetical protein
MFAETPIRIRVRRNQAQPNNIERDKQFHHERAAFLHKLAQDLNLNVLEWGNTDTPKPHEVVEILVVIAGTAAAGALMTAFKGWLDRDEAVPAPPMGSGVKRDVEVIVGGSSWSLRNYEVPEILQHF